MSTRKKRIAVLTGTRAEYGLLRSTLDAIDNHPKLTLQLVVAGMHLLKKFGMSAREIERDGRTIDARIRMQRGTDDPLDQADGLARGVRGCSRFFHEARTDVVLVLGDRIEALAAALAAVTTGKLLAHMHGGDLAPGDFDESIRHSITKLAHLHFPATREAAQRIRRMGEPARCIHHVGAPGLDRIREIGLHRRKNGRPRKDRALVLHHPSGRSPDQERRVMSRVLRAVTAGGWNATVIYPNSDRGHSGIIEAIEKARKKHDALQVMPTMPHDQYLKLLSECDVLVGNSSSGIIEASGVGTPAVNIGERQLGRTREAGAVIDCDERAESIELALRRARKIGPITAGRGIYGDGKTGKRVADILARLTLHPGAHIKKWRD